MRVGSSQIPNLIGLSLLKIREKERPLVPIKSRLKVGRNGKLRPIELNLLTGVLVNGLRIEALFRTKLFPSVKFILRLTFLFIRRLLSRSRNAVMFLVLLVSVLTFLLILVMVPRLILVSLVLKEFREGQLRLVDGPNIILVRSQIRDGLVLMTLPVFSISLIVPRKIVPRMGLFVMGVRRPLKFFVNGVMKRPTVFRLSVLQRGQGLSLPLMGRVDALSRMVKLFCFAGYR